MVYIKGLGAVSPAGWGVASLRDVVQQCKSLATMDLPGPSSAPSVSVRKVPPISSKPGFFAHPRLRRTSSIAQYAVAAALEALGGERRGTGENSQRLGIIYCAMAGCVKYSQRFYDETLRDPATASPLVFPETVFNAPASHLGALLGTSAVNYTLVGDPGTFLQGLALGADWVLSGRIDDCVVIGAEELDWLVANAFRLFDPAGIVSEGAGAVYMGREPGPLGAVALHEVTAPQNLSPRQSRARAALRVRAQLKDVIAGLLCDSCNGVERLDADEESAWRDWDSPRWSPKKICGEGFMAAAGWQCVLAADSLARGMFDSATVNVVGVNQQAIAARFLRGECHPKGAQVTGMNSGN